MHSAPPAVPDVLPAPPSADTLAAEPASTCANCGAVLPGAFCPACGQKAQPLRVPVHRLASDSLVEFFGIDGRIWRTLGVLLFKPGKLTAEHHAGRRTRYLKPLRLYISATLVFFVLLSVLDPVGYVAGEWVRSAPADTTLRAGDRVAELDSLLATVTARQADAEPSGPEASARRGAAVDSARWRLQRTWIGVLPADSLVRTEPFARAARLLVPDTTGREAIQVGVDGVAVSAYAQRVRDADPGRERVEAVAELARAGVGRVPTVMFLLLPLFAGLLKLLYVRRGWFYSEHVVFALHAHAVAFVAFTLAAVLLRAGTEGWSQTLAQGALLALPVHFVMAQKRVYRQGWGKTLVKAALLGVMYSVLLLIGMVAALALAATLG